MYRRKGAEEGAGGAMGGCLSTTWLLKRKKSKQSRTGELKEAEKEGLRKTNTSHCEAEMLL